MNEANDRAASAGGDGEASLVLETSLALDGESRTAQARRLAVGFLTRAGEDHGIALSAVTVENAQLIVSELVTNARKYAPGPALLRLRITLDVLRVELWDSNPLPPTVRAPDPGRVGQHGLEIVAALARTVTVERTPLGKRVVADIALHAAGP
ncbi:ATP-binding protein [Streptomyces sp. NPDC048566]|uniref:ATP-binding protein n=1 Tax=Streptomyces sp. NPDC048566 TaxID=3365569 RepID=UPI0037213243